MGGGRITDRHIDQWIKRGLVVRESGRLRVPDPAALEAAALTAAASSVVGAGSPGVAPIPAGTILGPTTASLAAAAELAAKPLRRLPAVRRLSDDEAARQLAELAERVVRGDG